MPLDQNPPQTVTRFVCVGFSMYACGFSVPKIKMSFIWKKDFFLLKLASSVSRSQAYTQLYSFGGRIKLIIWQIRHELSATIHEISARWKNVRWRTLYLLCMQTNGAVIHQPKEVHYIACILCIFFNGLLLVCPEYKIPTVFSEFTMYFHNYVLSCLA